jgi:hypothetical protein
MSVYRSKSCKPELAFFNESVMHASVLTVCLCMSCFACHFFICRSELATFNESVMLHASVPKAVEDVIHAMPHDAHPMAVILTGEGAGGCQLVEVSLSGVGVEVSWSGSDTGDHARCGVL